jgi:hypothetical protein
VRMLMLAISKPNAIYALLMRGEPAKSGGSSSTRPRRRRRLRLVSSIADASLYSLATHTTTVMSSFGGAGLGQKVIKPNP